MRSSGAIERGGLVGLPRRTWPSWTLARPAWLNGTLGLHLAAGLLLLIVLLPFLWLVQLSLRPADDPLGYGLLFRPTLENYVGLWRGHFPRSFLNSLVTSTLSTGLSLLVGVPAAYALSRCRFRGRHAVALWILVTRMAPPIAFTIPFFLAYRWMGLLDTVWGLALIYLTFNLALVVWMMRTFFDSTPESLEQAAWIDGCGIWQAFYKITLPLTARGITAGLSTCAKSSFHPGPAIGDA